MKPEVRHRLGAELRLQPLDPLGGFLQMHGQGFDVEILQPGADQERAGAQGCGKRQLALHRSIARTYVAAATNWPAWRCSCDVSPALTIETSISGRLRRSATLIILQGNHSSTFPPVRSHPYGLLGPSPADGGRGGGDDIRAGQLVAAAT